MIFDESALGIVRSTSMRPMTATDLSHHCDMPIATCYRWLRRLQSLGLLAAVDGPLAANGRPSRLYKSALRSILIALDDAKIRTRIELNTGAVNFVSDHETRLEQPETVVVSQSSLRRRMSGPDPIVHVIDPPRATRATRRKPPLLPPFLWRPASGVDGTREGPC